MHLRVSRVRRNGKLYEYAQLVESYRRPADGMPAHRVIANLGRRTAQEISNLRAALAASRKGRRVVVARSAKPLRPNLVRPQQNLRYLDVAVLWELWRQWGLAEVLDELLPVGASDVAPSKVIAALAVQRCVAPGSKLYAQRWFPTSALPELLGVAPSSFNNTRLHRVLAQLDQVTPALMKRLPRLYLGRGRKAAFASLFLDVTDTWFAGHGPELAERGKTKEGLVLKKIGIVLMCNEHGYPLRWKVLPGTQGDAEAMTQMVRSVAGLKWLGEAPVVCDRAMGNTAQVRALVDAKIRFLTALTVNEFGTYAKTLPHQRFADLWPERRPDDEEVELVEQAAELAIASGMEKLADDMFVLDLGVIERKSAKEERKSSQASHASEVEVEVEVKTRAQMMMRLGQRIKEEVAVGQADSYLAAGRALGLKDQRTMRYVQLCRLPEDIQEQLLQGALPAISLHRLVALSRLGSPEQQRRQFEHYLQQTDKTIEALRLARLLEETITQRRASSAREAGRMLGLNHAQAIKLNSLRKISRDIQEQILEGKAIGVTLIALVRLAKMKTLQSQRGEFQRLLQLAATHVSSSQRQGGNTSSGTAVNKPHEEPIRVRVVVSFNPERFVNQRRIACKRLNEIERFVSGLNTQLASPYSKRDHTKISTHIETRLRRDKLLDIYDVAIEPMQAGGNGRKNHRYCITLSLKPHAWARRRRYDGFAVLIAHPELSHSAEHLCRLYRAKDAVEKDFQVIKSFVKLRPVRHRTDAKVRAHIAVCMLALLLERTLRDRLAGQHASEAALESLSSCHLNRYAVDDSSLYTVTEPTNDQNDILKALQLQHLANDSQIADRILPR